MHNPVNLVDTHAPLDPAVNGSFLVQGKVMTGLCPEYDKYLFQGTLRLVLHVHIGLQTLWGMLEIGNDPVGQFFSRGYNVGQPCVDGASGHAVEFGRGGCLDKDQPDLFLYGLKAQRAVRTHAGKNDTYALILPVVCEGTEEEINGQPQTPYCCGFEQIKDIVQNGQVSVRGDHIDAIGLDLHPVFGLVNRHTGGTLEQFHHNTLVRWVQVLNNDKCHAALYRHLSQE